MLTTGQFLFSAEVLEKVVFVQIADFIQHHFVSPCQFGFLKNRSTLQQLVAFLSTILDSFSENCQTDVIYLDIRKAFDTVSHSVLLRKVWNAGITGSTWEFLKAYHSSRLQCVSINGSKSDLLSVLSGVPQGSLLGPLLFLIYINDLPLMAKFSSLFLFADDSKCSKKVDSSDDCILLQEDLDRFYKWSLHSQLSFNLGKSSQLSFCSVRHTPLVYPTVLMVSLFLGTLLSKTLVYSSLPIYLGLNTLSLLFLRATRLLVFYVGPSPVLLQSELRGFYFLVWFFLNCPIALPFGGPT